MQSIENELQAAKAELETAKADAETLRGQLSTKETELSTKASELQAKAEEVERLTGELATATAARDGFENDAKTARADVERLKGEAKSAEMRAAEICAQTGVDALRVTHGNAPGAVAAAGKLEELVEAYNAETNPTKRAAIWAEIDKLQ